MSRGAAEPVGDVATALAHGARLMSSNPSLAAQQASEILKVAPGQPQAVRLLAAAWRAIGDQRMLSGDEGGADQAYAQSIRAGVQDPVLMRAAAALCDNDIPAAEHALKAYLKAQPSDPAAIRMLAEVAARLGRFGDAEKLLVRCLELAPSFAAARHNYAIVLYRQSKSLEALPEIERLLAQEPENASYLNLKAAVLARLGEYGESIALYETVLKTHPAQPKVWMSYGHALKTEGRAQDSIAAYRKSVQMAPAFGEGWWSLANLKTFSFSDADVAAMQGALKHERLDPEDRYHLHYALGKALEDRRAYEDSFTHYARGAALRRERLDYNAGSVTEQVDRARAFFTPEQLQHMASHACAAADPIFIIGLPRSGSTLIEQMLSSHSQVEGTMELPDLGMIARRLGEKKVKHERSKYPEALATLEPDALRALGEDYLRTTRIQRKTGRPYFIDKMPNNWLHVGLILAILPNAKIIDVRRHPMAAGFSAFKQHFARGQGFSYSLDDIGRYYRDYVRMLAHIDRVWPGRVHRVHYEAVVSDTEAELRRLLGYCGLPFEEECLRFYDNQRAVRTASSEQVRQPIFSDAVEHWRHYEPHLDDLKRALGPVLDAYPNAPAND
ncbi:MAG: sulfotransferase [Hyphomonadaceae bacterium]